MKINGRVQGVFFRAVVQRKAESLGITGWVRNLPDGAVEAVFEGEENAVNMLVDFSRHGPIGAKVSKVEVDWELYKDEFNSFSIV